MLQGEGVYYTGTCSYPVLTWLNLPLLSPVLGEEKEPGCHQCEGGELDVTPSQLAQRAQAMMITTSSCHSTRLLWSSSQGPPYPDSLSRELHLWRELKKPFQRLILNQCWRQSQKLPPQTPLRKLQSPAQSEPDGPDACTPTIILVSPLSENCRAVQSVCPGRGRDDHGTANLYPLHVAL
uniref:Uncharacterized protein n=1 Tax=Knipowitschia caucasica TaxID=637954 RepID=A0AAV2LX14_KNICA